MMKYRFMFYVVPVFLALTITGTSWAKTFQVGGHDLQVMGLINQGISWGIAGDNYNTKDNFQSSIFDVIVEAKYTLSNNLQLNGIGMLSGDWAYPILSNNDDWTDKQFNKSRDRIYLDTDFNDVAQELHMTWAPGNTIIRVGKQIVVWGETDAFRITDQINPVDQRRGLSDVEFESTILPIWLVRAEQFWQPESDFIQDVSLQVVFNPNAQFEPDRAIELGNDVAGIWAPNVEFGPGVRLGSSNMDITERDEWDKDGMEIGVRLRTIINDTILSMCYFNGIDNSPVTKVVGAPTAEVAYDGSTLLHLPMEGYYARLRYAGLTLTRDLPGLAVSFLGGVAPVLRMDGMYGFDTTFILDDLSAFYKSDEFRYVVGADWKVKIPFLNPRAYFMISPQFYHRRIIDYPTAGLHNLKEDNYQTSLVINTTYLHNKLIPGFVWLRDYTNHSNFFKYTVDYEYSSSWKLTVGTIFFDGKDEGKGFEPLEEKDQVFTTLSYKF